MTDEEPGPAIAEDGDGARWKFEAVGGERDIEDLRGGLGARFVDGNEVARPRRVADRFPAYGRCMVGDRGTLGGVGNRIVFSGPIGMVSRSG
jgi:hypothetical protein